MDKRSFAVRFAEELNKKEKERQRLFELFLKEYYNNEHLRS